ncbi:hypothetical protein HA402_001902 [Bradysia odoriphaga]|nr:hypothetical protein HA402_001902 [Bradysia odoriphaga]
MDCVRTAKMNKNSVRSAKVNSTNGLQKTHDTNQAKHEASKTPASEHQQMDDKTSSASSTREKFSMDAKPLPEHIRKFIQRKNSWKSEAQKKQARKRKQEFANKVGWQKRFGRHRHQHQADRERQLLNYQQGLPLDYDEDDVNDYY